MLMFEKTVEFINGNEVKRFSRDTESLRRDLSHIINLFTNECDLNLIYGHYNRNALVIRALLRAKLHIVTKNQESLKNSDINNFFSSLAKFLSGEFNEFFIIQDPRDIKIISINAKEIGIGYEDFLKFVNL